MCNERDKPDRAFKLLKCAANLVLLGFTTIAPATIIRGSVVGV